MVRDEIARLCYEHYGTRLPKKGKPEPNREWTLLAAVVKVQLVADRACGGSNRPTQVTKEVVSMGTGTKCIGQSKMRKSGDILNDSHAEVIARRSFQRYLHYQLHLAAALKEDSIFVPGTQRGLWKLRPDLLFVFFSSHTPCGDASIIPMLEFEDQPCCPVSRDWANNPSVEADGNLEAPENKKKCEDLGSPVTKKMRLEPGIPDGVGHHQSFGNQESGPIPPSISGSNLTTQELATVTGMAPSGAKVVDVYRTGAKCVPGEAGDSGKPGAAYHQVGLLRVKPGRGDRTCSMSCSDKLARWNVLGCQGALLMHLLEKPIYLSAVVIGRCPYSQEAMQRALTGRCQNVSALPKGFGVQEVKIQQSGLLFEHSRCTVQAKRADSPGRLVPCGAAISWSAVPEQPLDVTANGFPQGTTKKGIRCLQASSSVAARARQQLAVGETRFQGRIVAAVSAHPGCQDPLAFADMGRSDHPAHLFASLVKEEGQHGAIFGGSIILKRITIQFIASCGNFTQLGATLGP
ncbi:tRNA-specific adenosine deaminase 1 isoform X4 [Canis lupus dingo]|uniref:tRNA-specific adenosine deaminase 1 isoform X4 n=1 Tax=Canis lupus dingo TaxID=286419 RepID=UPI000DC68F2C|nr:tRNA-specific adenosine deaminase 1 isoform X4 [Canis lupus dingo]XP_025282653.1 tRNA-specific adenosine deaminase 1 isoform X4 [Canis lupus dingo]XP_038522928.1 tRNA-specific adenosine deaminase 1 isoform X3 [Canis lupus familiaris]XP_038522929.1 tRNA-specific adenosine deaminase 1 isoform X3 [Canis lupus familiaris]